MPANRAQAAIRSDADSSLTVEFRNGRNGGSGVGGTDGLTFSGSVATRSEINESMITAEIIAWYVVVGARSER